jgi:aryl-alcohol dehydrogenase-like predicted oxidoreductase
MVRTRGVRHRREETTMQRRKLGRTGLEVSVLGFGCGTVGGLMTNGEPRAQEQAVARAVELGINYIDTAAQYGKGRSETNLGRVLAALKPDVIVATKCKAPNVERGRLGPAITASLEASLRRLGRSHVDLFQLHNAITAQEKPGTLTPARVINEVVPALQRLVEQGKARFFGMTGLGETGALMQVIDTGSFFSAQVPLNLLNPTPAYAMPPGYPAQDYARMLERMAAVGMGGVGIRVVAGGALSSDTPHPLAKANVEPMGSGSSFASDTARAARFEPLVREGHATSLAEAAIRYTMACPHISTVLLGLSDPAQLDGAVRAAAAGPLSTEGLALAARLQHALVGEPR